MKAAARVIACFLPMLLGVVGAHGMEPHGAALWRTVSQAISGSPVAVDSLYDPEVEFQEIAVSVSGTRTWKVYGPYLTRSVRWGTRHRRGGGDDR